jgi:hypothetical protein
MTRDPLSDPQPGDELQSNGVIRGVFKREGEKLLIDGPRTRYWMRVDHWREWCNNSRAEASQK